MNQPATIHPPGNHPPGPGESAVSAGREAPTPVCIAGMHRSGTSLVAKLLNLCGLYLGQERDLMPASSHNPDGFWENVKFVELNDLILHELGGGWDYPPPVRDEWEQLLSRLRGRAGGLLQEFAEHSVWGWKDPRNSLTLPFWARLLPRMRLVICLRNPLEVALSLKRRNFFSYSMGLALWRSYNERALECSQRAPRVVTHYDALLADPRAETRRILNCLGLPPSGDWEEAVAASAKSALRKHRFSTRDLFDADVARDTIALYLEMCDEAGRPAEPALMDADRSPASAGEFSRGRRDNLPAVGDEAPVTERRARREVDLCALESRLQSRELPSNGRDAASPGPTGPAADPRDGWNYGRLVARVVDTICAVIPEEAAYAVISDGDEELLQRGGRRGWHFPQTSDGTYAGGNPLDSQAAIAQLETLRLKGAEFLVFPATTFWWLDYYGALDNHLRQRYRELLHSDACTIFDVREINSAAAVPHSVLQRLAGAGSSTPRRRILACGIYLADQPNTVDHVVGALESSGRHEVVQRWVALCGDPPTRRVAEVTVVKLPERAPKFTILDRLLAAEDREQYDFIVLVDDDIVVPDGFLEAFIGLQDELDFAMAQPARTGNSFIDHPIVRQQPDILARRTMFVEIGPVVGLQRSCFGLVLPFDLTSPMGWGYENVWSRRLAERGLKMGIIDAVAVDHSLRRPVQNYSRAEADRQRKAYLAKVPHYPQEQCLRVLEVSG